MGSNLSSLWVSGGYDQKVQLQDLLFPGGILFDKQKENYRTEKINSVLELTHSFTQALKQNKNGQIKSYSDLPALVDRSRRISNFFVEDLIRFGDLRGSINLR